VEYVISPQVDHPPEQVTALMIRPALGFVFLSPSILRRARL